jgi:hypothetical protein
MSPTIVVGDMLFLLCRSVDWLVGLFMPTLTFCNIESSNLIFGMQMHLLKLHIIIGERSRSSFKVRGQIYVAKIAHFMNSFAILKIAT